MLVFHIFHTNLFVFMTKIPLKQAWKRHFWNKSKDKDIFQIKSLVGIFFSRRGIIEHNSSNSLWIVTPISFFMTKYPSETTPHHHTVLTFKTWKGSVARGYFWDKSKDMDIEQRVTIFLQERVFWGYFLKEIYVPWYLWHQSHYQHSYEHHNVCFEL